MVPMLLSFLAAMARDEAATAIFAILIGCAVVVFNKQFTQDALAVRRRRSGREQAAWEEKISRIVAVVCGIGFVVWGGALLLGFGHIRGWN